MAWFQVFPIFHFPPLGGKLVPSTKFSCTGTSVQWLKHRVFFVFLGSLSDCSPWDVFLSLCWVCSAPWFQPWTGRVVRKSCRGLMLIKWNTWVVVNPFWVNFGSCSEYKDLKGECLEVWQVWAVLPWIWYFLLPAHSSCPKTSPACSYPCVLSL